MIELTDSHLDRLAEAAETWRQKLNLPGMVCGVAQHGSIVGVRSSGYADRERKRAFTAETCVRVASNTKSMTAALAASFISDGIFTWDTPVHHIYPDFRLSNTTLSKQTILADLFSMRLGLASSELIFQSEGLTSAELFEKVATLPLEAPPRERMIYNNDVFAVAGLLVAIAAGYTLDDSLEGYVTLLEESLLKSWGLHTAGVGSDINRFGDDYALPYEPDARSWGMNLVGLPDIGAYAPAGGVFASTNDMLGYLLTHLESYNSGNRHDPLQACFSDYAPVDKPIHHYGLGWAIEHHGDYDVFWHNGGIDGFLSHMAFIPQGDAAFFAVTNAGTGDYYVKGLRAAFQCMLMGLEEPFAVLDRHGAADLARREAVRNLLAASPTSEQVDTAVGQYERGTWIEKREGDDALLLHIEPRAMRLYPIAGENAFMTVGLSDVLRVDILTEADGLRLVIREFGTGEPLPEHGGWRKLE